MLVDDGTQRYLHAGGVLAGIDASNNAAYPLLDGLGSVRGRTDGTGALVGTANYDAFGAIRSQTGAGGTFGFAGEQRDAETGLTYLRARMYSPGLGRFLSRDTVSPNAPGTQGYNPYAYAANNPTTWTDPSGHAVGGLRALGEALARIFYYIAYAIECAVGSGGDCAGGRGPLDDGWFEEVEGSIGQDANCLLTATHFFPNSSGRTTTSCGGGGGPITAPKTFQGDEQGPPIHFPEGTLYSENPNAADAIDLRDIAELIYYGLWKAGYTSAMVFITGSRLTGVSRSDDPNKPMEPTRADSDWDIGIADESLFALAEHRGFAIKRSSNAPRTNPLSVGAMQSLGVDHLPSHFAAWRSAPYRPGLRIAGPVTYVIYDGIKSFTNLKFGREAYKALPIPYVDFEPAEWFEAWRDP